MSSRKYESGAQKRKNREKLANDRKRMAGSMDKFMLPCTSVTLLSSNSNAPLPGEYRQTNNDRNTKQPQRHGCDENSQQVTTFSSVEGNAKDLYKACCQQPLPIAENMVVQQETVTSTTDPASWPEIISSSIRSDIVKLGAVQVKKYKFPKSKENRRFNPDFYSKMLPNGETIVRTWLVYSIHQDAVYCFCCKLFGCNKMKLTSEGFNSWQYLSKTLEEHEKSTDHRQHMMKWKELEFRLKTASTLDKQAIALVEKERTHYRAVLERILAIVLFLAERNMAFRGVSDRLYAHGNGNFLGEVQLLAKFDPILAEHLRRIQNAETVAHYLGPDIQNELISLISDHILKEITNRAKAAKYYSIILDCTSDISHQEQMTMIIRFVELQKDKTEIKEYFVGFLKVTDTSGAGLFESLLEKLASLGLDMMDCRGQSYDNGSNMKGKHSGVQARFLQKNPRAFYLPCMNHSLNLVVCDAASSSVTAVSFFGCFQLVYSFFASSTSRWNTLKEFCSITVKYPSNTRWESKIESVKALRFKTKDIHNALISIRNASKGKDSKAYSEANALAAEIASFRFLLCLVIWYNLLTDINKVSKLLQHENMQIDVAQELISSTQSLLRKYRENETFFSSAVNVATELCEQLEIPAEMPSERRRRVPQHFGYESEDEPLVDALQNLKVNFFFHAIDVALVSLGERFDMLSKHNDIFAFLYNIPLLKHWENQKLLEHCAIVSTALTVYTGDNVVKADIEKTELAEELRSLSHFLSPECKKVCDVTDYIQKSGLMEIFPNVLVALRIILSMRVENAVSRN